MLPASSTPGNGAEPNDWRPAMRPENTRLRFQAPLRLQGLNSVRVIWTAEEAADWIDETWDPQVRERLRLIGQSLRQAIDHADCDRADQARDELAEALIKLKFLAPPDGR